MDELYPYCSKCDKELNSEEHKMNMDYKNLFYPICKECLAEHVKNIKEIIEKGTDEQ